MLNGAEECDGNDLGGAGCESLGFDSGNIACGQDCTLDDSGCGYGPLPDADVDVSVILTCAHDLPEPNIFLCLLARDGGLGCPTGTVCGGSEYYEELFCHVEP